MILRLIVAEQRTVYSLKNTRPKNVIIVKAKFSFIPRFTDKKKNEFFIQTPKLCAEMLNAHYSWTEIQQVI